MIVAHIYIDGEPHRRRMAEAPRVGDTLRVTGDVLRQVTEVIWCLDEGISDDSRIDIHTKEAPPPPVPITVAMVTALRKESDHPMHACKDALRACNGDMDAAREWLRVGYATYMWGKS